MNWIHAVVNVQTKRYTGSAVVMSSHGDDTLTVLEEVSGHRFRVHKDDMRIALVTEQSLTWITEQLLDAWQPFLTRLARHLAEQLQDYAKFGGADEANAVFQSYLDEPPRAFHALCRREV
jgi:regulation of enolase protein 1 (concanavalin A-like superfamily)